MRGTTRSARQPAILRVMQVGPGPRPFDVSTRHLIESDPVGWLAWVGLPPDGPVRSVESDVGTVLAAVDKVLRIDAPSPWLAHFELQASYDRQLPFRLLQYHALLLCRHELPVETTIVLLRRSADGPEMTGRFEHGRIEGQPTISFTYRVVRIWEHSVDELLRGGLSTLPLAPLAATPEQLLEVLRLLNERFGHEAAPGTAQELRAATAHLLGLRYDEPEVREVMRRMSWVQEAYRTIAEVERAEGLVEGREEGRADEARRIILAVGTRRFGAPDATTVAAIEAIRDVDALERLIDPILISTSWQELLAAASGADTTDS
jgi:hypothetical protein